MPEQRPMSLFDTNKWTIGVNNKLYWDGKPVVTEDKIVLQKSLNVAVYLTAASTAVYALVEVLKFLGYGAR